MFLIFLENIKTITMSNATTMAAIITTTTQTAIAATIPEWLTNSCLALAWSELLLLHPSVIAIGCLNLAILYFTRVLHPNLRFILQIQSCAVLGVELYRLIMIFWDFARQDIFYNGPVALQRFGLSIALFKNCIAHILLIERLLATFFHKKYEKFTKFYHFSLPWFIILTGLALFNFFSATESMDFTLTNLITTIFLVVSGIVEFFAISIIGFYNKRKYNRFLPNGNYSLNEKYQLAENVRASRQLCPVFFCHLLNNIPTLIIGLLMRMGFLEEYEMAFSVQLIVIFVSIVDFFIELTVITHHPAMKKRFKTLLHKLFLCKYNGHIFGGNSSSVVDIAVQNANQRRSESPPKTLNGQPLIHRNHPDSHFRMLTSAWRVKDDK